MSKDQLLDGKLSVAPSVDNKSDNGELYHDYELTRSQSLILTGQQLQPNDPHYNMVLLFRISGVIEHHYFQQAFQAVIAQCDALRTVVINTSNQNPIYKQRVFEQHNYTVELVDLSMEIEVESSFNQWLEHHKKINFNIEQCLFESVLIKLSENQFCWYFNQHHLLTDAWSMEVIFNQVQNGYQLAKNRQLEQVTSLPSFQSYAHKERSKQSSKSYISAQQYWQKKLSTQFVPSTFYRPTPQLKSGKTTRVPCKFGVQRSERIRALATQPEFTSFSTDLSIMTLFTTMLFALMHKLSGNDELSIGTPTHSRTSADLRKTAGLLINIFPLQVEISQDSTFKSLYEKVAQANQQLLINAIPGSNDLVQNRAFDVLLNYIPSSFGKFDQMSTQVDWIHSGFSDRNHLLRLQIHDFDRDGEFSLYFDLNEDVFVGEEKQWLTEHFLLLADAMLDDVEQQVATCALIPATTRLAYQNPQENLLLNTSDYVSVNGLFDIQAKRSMTSTALRCGHSTMSYQQLAKKSTQLAHHLVSQGVTTGSVVAVMMDRSIDAVCAIYGILKSGATFLPIDSQYPQERIAFMLEDAAVDLIITEPEYNQLAKQFHQNKLLLTEHWQATNVQLAQSLLPEIKAIDLAYIIYTSGSTGRPKGVPISHCGLSNYISWAKEYYVKDQALNFPLFSSLSFDLTITSLFAPLISGGELIIYPESNDGADITIRRVIEDNQVDIIKLTPAHLSLIHVMDFSLSRLQALIVGGEDFKTDLAKTINKYFDGRIDIYNEYGPTEATVACTVHKYQPKVDTQASVPIGRPITSADIYIYDECQNLVPQGVSGEIYIAGQGLSAGYLNQQELNQQRFVDNPHHLEQRLYRSGDLARFNARGEIEYLGRNDQQVKVHGVRIETGEIETALLAIDNISDAVVHIAENLTLIKENESAENCVKCGLASNHPSARLDSNKLCRICRVYQQQKAQAQAYFREHHDLTRWITNIKREATGKQDCIMLLSGGKDSSYALCKLVDLGLTPLVFTLDNGFISEGAKENIKRLVDRLGLELVVGETPAMNAIFADSLTRFSNVCNGCFKTIYTLSMNIARERGIKIICTGLSRGQIFESRVAHLFQQGCFDASKIDERIIDARKVYHRTQDIITTTLNVEIFEDDQIFNDIQYLDYYRYCDVTLDEMYQYLINIAPWIRPSDTGRSTNCLINDVGIYIHKKERGYHNYALPYSWDVRLGHKERNAALDELNDEIDQQKVDDILNKVGYQSRDIKFESATEDKLFAYYVSPAEITKSTLQKHLSKTLPSEYIPTQFVWMSALPLTANGKVDRQALPRPRNSRRELTIDYVAPTSDVETTLAMLWSKLLGVEEVGVADNFFDLGGDSIVNIQIVAAARDKGIELTPQQIFDFPTIKGLANVAGTLVTHVAEQGSLTGEVMLLPSQARYLSDYVENLNQFSQSVMLKFDGVLDTELLQQAFTQLLTHHDGLRSCFKQTESGWQQQILGTEQIEMSVLEIDFSEQSYQQTELDVELDRQCQLLTNTLDIFSGKLVAVANIKHGKQEENYLLIVINHLVVDGVSWWVLLGDLERCYSQLVQHEKVQLPRKTCSVKQWGHALMSHAQSDQVLSNAQYWWGSSLSENPHTTATLHDDNQKKPVIKTVCSFLNHHETQQLVHYLPSRFGVQVPEVLLTALLQVLLAWTDKSTLQVDIEGHGREQLPSDVKGADLDVTRTISWFTSVYPVSFKLSDSKLPGDDLRAVKEQLRAVPNHGFEYELLRYLTKEPTTTNQSLARLKKHPPSELLFNYMGQWDRTLNDDSQFKFVRPIQANYGADRLCHHALEVNATIYDGRLQVEWTFDENRYPCELVDNLLAQFTQTLQTLINFGLATDESGYTPADFSSAGIGQNELDDIFEEFGE